MNTFSASKIATFRTCQKKFYYNYIEKIPTKDAPPLLLGSMFHKMLELYYAGESVEEVLKEYQGYIATGVIEAAPNMLESVFDEYVKYYRDIKNTETLLHNESKIEIAFDEDQEDIMVGIVDKIVKRDDGTVILRDHKTTSGKLKYTPDNVRYNPQQLLYHQMAEHGMNLHVDAIEIDEVRLAVLEEVPRLKDGKPSTDKRKLGLVTEESYRAVLQELGEEDNEDYTAILGYLAWRGHPLFNRVMVQLLEPAVSQTNLEDIEATMKQMKREKVFPRTIGRLCDWCAFRQICHLDFHSPEEHDRQIVIKTL